MICVVSGNVRVSWPIGKQIYSGRIYRTYLERTGRRDELYVSDITLLVCVVNLMTYGGQGLLHVCRSHCEALCLATKGIYTVIDFRTVCVELLLVSCTPVG